MNRLLLVRYGEINLKGSNRNYFINTLADNIRFSLRNYRDIKIKKIQGRIAVENIPQDIEPTVIDALKKVFGIVYLTKAYEVEAQMDAIKNAAYEIMREKSDVTFKVESKRGDKNFPLTSPEISKTVGAHILTNIDNLKVNVHQPDILLTIEVRKQAYIYYENIHCDCGLPVGTGGKAGVLLSGGIDSPVAAYLMAKRGMKVDGIHFHAYPYTSLNAKKKVIDLAEKISKYTQGMTLYIVSVTEIQENIIKNCRADYLTVLLRRYMLRLSEEIAKKYGLQALITGESLGQVASQTVESIACTNAAVDLPIFRPLIGTDKNDTVTIAKHIDTYDISIQPFEDCCTLFVPRHPAIKPSREKVIAEESKLDSERLLDNALNTIETIKL